MNYQQRHHPQSWQGPHTVPLLNTCMVYYWHSLTWFLAFLILNTRIQSFLSLLCISLIGFCFGFRNDFLTSLVVETKICFFWGHNQQVRIQEKREIKQIRLAIKIKRWNIRTSERKKEITQQKIICNARKLSSLSIHSRIPSASMLYVVHGGGRIRVGMRWVGYLPVGELPVHNWKWPATSVKWGCGLRNASKLPPGPLEMLLDASWRKYTAMWRGSLQRWASYTNRSVSFLSYATQKLPLAGIFGPLTLQDF
jgi:hypothetical protein